MIVIMFLYIILSLFVIGYYRVKIETFRKQDFDFDDKIYNFFNSYITSDKLDYKMLPYPSFLKPDDNHIIKNTVIILNTIVAIFWIDLCLLICMAI